MSLLRQRQVIEEINYQSDPRVRSSRRARHYTLCVTGRNTGIVVVDDEFADAIFEDRVNAAVEAALKGWINPEGALHRPGHSRRVNWRQPMADEDSRRQDTEAQHAIDRARYAERDRLWDVVAADIEPYPTRIEVTHHADVCPLCDGTGRVVNPAIDAGGLTRDDIYDDPEFADAYLRGDYDRGCPECHGANVVRVPTLPRWLSDAVQAMRDSEAEMHAERMAEIRAGC